MPWEAVATPPSLHTGEVHVWRTALEADGDRQRECLETLAPAERERAAAFNFEAPRRRFIVARGSLRALLACYLDVGPRELVFVYGEHGKPALAAATDLTFNLSHSGDLLLLACTRGRDLGIDVERTQREVRWEQVAHRFFAERELADLLALPEAQQRNAFFRCWTRKEAYMKATGHGVALGLSNFAVSLAPDTPPALVWLQHGRPDDWRLADVEVGPGYAGALCAAGANWQPRWLRLPP